MSCPIHVLLIGRETAPDRSTHLKRCHVGLHEPFSDLTAKIIKGWVVGLSFLLCVSLLSRQVGGPSNRRLPMVVAGVDCPCESRPTPRLQVVDPDMSVIKNYSSVVVRELPNARASMLVIQRTAVGCPRSGSATEDLNNLSRQTDRSCATLVR